MDPEAATARYYAQRAPQYERVYHKPERQADLSTLREIVVATCAGKRVLDVACGTGYWTEIIAGAATSVVAIDINEEVLAVARTKNIPAEKVTFLKTDVYALPPLPYHFDAALLGFWWSHVPKARLPAFLQGLCRSLDPGATVIVFDNAYVEGSSTPLSRVDSDGNPVSHRDADGNTYQQRVLDDGSTHQIVKNFPAAEELCAAVQETATEVNVKFLTYYWILTFQTTSHLSRAEKTSGHRRRDSL